MAEDKESLINQKLDNGGNTLIIFFPSILSRNMFAQHIRGNGVGEGGDHAGGKPSLGTGLLNACAPTAAGWQTGRGPGGHSMGPQEARGDKWGIWVTEDMQRWAGRHTGQVLSQHGGGWPQSKDPHVETAPSLAWLPPCRSALPTASLVTLPVLWCCPHSYDTQSQNHAV